MAYYPEAGNHIRDKIKVVLDLSCYQRITKNKTMVQILIDVIYWPKKILLLWKLRLIN